MRGAILGVAVGFVSGFLSGQFGIGGGLITTPAIRLLLGRPALVAVGTPLPVIVPTALVGAASYIRAGLADVRGGLVIGGVGAVVTVPAALATRLVGGTAVLLITAVVIAYMALHMLVTSLRDRSRGPEGQAEATSDAASAPRDGEALGSSAALRPSWSRLAMLGVLAGAYSGFLGLGGGFVVIPVLTSWLHYPIKRAIGTSLVTISIMAIPGSVAHYLLGHVETGLALSMIVGVVPGVLLGAHVTRAARDRSVRIGFSVLLLATGLLLALAETGVL